MLKRNRGYYNINNYKNSKYFIEAVKKARQYQPGKELSIFAGACQSYYEGLILAGACQSYYEAIIKAGANFASSPGRILIDFREPLIVANEVAITDSDKFITIRNVENKLRNGRRGINGKGAFGKRKQPCNKTEI